LIKQGFGKAHHVVATGIEITSSHTVYLYDSNHPGKEMHIEYLPTLKVFKHSERSHLRGFFIDDGFALQKPAVASGMGNWRLCAKCACLYNDAINRGTCSTGGSHRTFTQDEYLLPAGAGSGQGGWRGCAKCNSLFFDGGGQACPQGGMHNSAGYEYFLPVNGRIGQHDWSCCIYCSCLFYQPAGCNGGVCTAGKEHDKGQSRKYSLPMR
jgi:hypothetical protein